MKIALVAMSGIRACDQQLLEGGLTLPGFVERSKTIAERADFVERQLLGALFKHECDQLLVIYHDRESVLYY